jgi:hypothetical protein
MKHINLILSVLFWAIASVSMAVTLPTSSYSSFVMDEEASAYSISTGTTFMNHSLTASGTSAYEKCSQDVNPDYAGNPPKCMDCCVPIVGTSDLKDLNLLSCLSFCTGLALGGDTPLDVPVYVPLAFILAYAGFMYYRRRKENAEQA